MKYLFYSVVAICITVLAIFLINKYGIVNILLGSFGILCFLAWLYQREDD